MSVENANNNEDLGQRVKELGREVALAVLLGLTLSGPAIGAAIFEAGRESACSDLQRRGVIIPTQPADPNISAPVIGHDACGDSIYGSDPSEPFGPFGGPFGQ